MQVVHKLCAIQYSQLRPNRTKSITELHRIWTNQFVPLSQGRCITGLHGAQTVLSIVPSESGLVGVTAVSIHKLSKDAATFYESILCTVSSQIC